MQEDDNALVCIICAQLLKPDTCSSNNSLLEPHSNFVMEFKNNKKF